MQKRNWTILCLGTLAAGIILLFGCVKRANEIASTTAEPKSETLESQLKRYVSRGVTRTELMELIDNEPYRHVDSEKESLTNWLIIDKDMEFVILGDVTRQDIMNARELVYWWKKNEGPSLHGVYWDQDNSPAFFEAVISDP